MLLRKKKHADGIFLTWLPILPLDLVKLLGTLKTGSTLKVCRRETPSAEVAHFTFIQQTRSLAVRNADQLNLLLHRYYTPRQKRHTEKNGTEESALGSGWTQPRLEPGAEGWRQRRLLWSLSSVITPQTGSVVLKACSRCHPMPLTAPAFNPEEHHR